VSGDESKTVAMKKLILIFCSLALLVEMRAQSTDVSFNHIFSKNVDSLKISGNSGLPNPLVYDGGKILGQKSIGSNSSYLDSIFELKMETYHIPGLAACIVKNGAIHWIGTYGWADMETSTLMDTSILFQLASTSKTITLTALMQLWENKFFNLDDDINDYLPWQVRNPGFPSDAITFRQLCTHTSSIKDNWSVMPYFWGIDSPIPLDEYLFDYLNPAGSYYNQYQNFYFTHKPGTYYSYSNIGVALAGLLVEEISGIPFYQFCQDSIFNPLEMTETSWFLSGIDTMHMARPYSWNGNSYIPYPFYSYPDYPDGALKTSVDQLARFLMSYLGNGSYNNQIILNAPTIDSIFTLQVPQLSNFQGLIWQRRSVAGIGEVWGHTGEDCGFSTEMSFNDENDIGAIVCINVKLDATIIKTFGNLLLQYALDSIYTSLPDNTVKIVKSLSNAPNPFTRSTILTYNLAESSQVTLLIFDSFGRVVAEPVNAFQEKGEKKFEWLAEALPAGVYYCTLYTGNHLSTNKLIKLH